MDVRIIDRDRNVAVVPTKSVVGPDVDYVAVMESLLLEGMPIHTGRIEFECDREFAEALEGQTLKPVGATFHNVPVIVLSN